MAAGPTEHLASDRPESWAMNYFTSVTLLTGLGPPRDREPWSIEPGLELGWIPGLTERQRRVGFNGTKVEDLNKSPIFARPQVTIGLPWSTALTLAYVPPIPVFGVTPNLFGMALARPLYQGTHWTAGVRAYGQIGHVDGDFTCSKANVRSRPGSPQNPLGCIDESSDTATQRYAGLELTGAYRAEYPRGFTPYVAVAGNVLWPEFQVDAMEIGGFHDQRRLVEDTTGTLAVTGGFVFPLGDRLRLNVDAFYSPLWVKRPPATSSDLEGVFNLRAVVTYEFSSSDVAEMLRKVGLK